MTHRTPHNPATPPQTPPPKRLPGDERTMVGFITFDSALHFYSLKVGGERATGGEQEKGCGGQGGG
jgi:hypothetical protein